jgi:tRNA(Arg) A34 adenosine deaminase TadA
VSYTLSGADEEFLSRAIELSRRALEDDGKTPFGAIIVIGQEVVAEGTSSVIELCDPTAHAEVMALRNAASKLRRHLMPDAVMYTSSEPCPLCLAACYWAQVPRLVFAATSHDVATYGFEDLQFYRELAHSAENRSLREDSADRPSRERAVEVLREWADKLPEPVEPKY